MLDPSKVVEQGNCHLMVLIDDAARVREVKYLRTRERRKSEVDFARLGSNGGRDIQTAMTIQSHKERYG